MRLLDKEKTRSRIAGDLSRSFLASQCFPKPFKIS